MSKGIGFKGSPLPFGRILDYAISISSRDIDLVKEYRRIQALGENKKDADQYMLTALNLIFPLKKIKPKKGQPIKQWSDPSWYTEIKNYIPQPNGKFGQIVPIKNSLGIDVQKAYRILNTIDDEIDKFSEKTMLLDRQTLFEMQNSHKKNFKNNKTTSQKT